MNFDSAQVMRQVLDAGRYDALQAQAFSPHQVNKAAAESGQAMGYTMHVVENPSQTLQDSLEELSFQFEEKEMKSAGARKLGERNTMRSAYLTAVDGWKAVMPDMPGGEYMERMRRQLRNMQFGGNLPDADGLLRMLREGSRDPAHQFAMLDILEKSLGPGDGDMKALFAAAKERLQAEHGEEIRAGLNIAETVNETARDVSEVSRLRDLYRSEVLGFTSPQACFRALLQRGGPGGVQEAVDFLVKSCTVDLASPEPSRVPEDLRRIMLDLQCVNVLTAMMDKLGALAGKMQSQFGVTCAQTGAELTSSVLALTEMPFVGEANIASLISQCGIGPLLAQLYFCTGLVDAFRGLSSRLFEKEGDREKLVDAGQEHLDGLVMQQQDEDERERREGAA